MESTTAAVHAHTQDWLGVSAEAKDLVAKLLKRSAKERLSAHAILQHPWIQQDAPETPLATPGVLSRFAELALLSVA